MERLDVEYRSLGTLFQSMLQSQAPLAKPSLSPPPWGSMVNFWPWMESIRGTLKSRQQAVVAGSCHKCLDFTAVVGRAMTEVMPRHRSL
ncbi:hypothetical protein EYF80_009044 [Liparis tanakae]|uniref:Uncharacterized protein n=1 Tax=Liparis tanakae TaxID=230148 RepID=A0A4Z2IU16_9TELE|nr:hypothetical protein EYF80_009044 [Liparis tanakae]